MNAIGRLVGTTLALAAMLGTARGSGQEGAGNAPLKPPRELSPKVQAVADLKSRVLWQDINGDLSCYYRGDIAAVNDAVKAFAEGAGRDVILWPGAGKYDTLDGKSWPCDFSLHVPGGLATTMLKSAKMADGTPVFDAEPTLTVYLGDAIPLDKLAIPHGLNVLDLHDLRERYVAGLKSNGDGAVADAKTAEERRDRTTKATIRAQSAYQLGMLGPIAKDLLDPLRAALRDREPYVRICAIDALGRLGALAAPAIPDLEAVGAASTDKGEKEAIDKAVATIKSSDPGPATAVEERMKATKILKTRRARIDG